MNNNMAPTIRLPLDITNPGQFYACCGLLQIADALVPGATGWFAGAEFCLAADRLSLGAVLEALATARLESDWPADLRARRESLAAISEADRPKADTNELKKLDALTNELPIRLSGGFSMRLDWFTDSRSGGSRFKTWAGRQSVLTIAQSMLTGVQRDVARASSPWIWSRGIGLPFNFDSDLGRQGAPLDVGFSFDPLDGSRMSRLDRTARPGLELLAFIGLQRFRPGVSTDGDEYLYTTWPSPLGILVSSAVASCAVPMVGATRYAFRLLYRTKYLKSFLPAHHVHGEIDE